MYASTYTCRPREQPGWRPTPHTAAACAGPTAKLEHVAERFSAFYSDLEQEKQVRATRTPCALRRSVCHLAAARPGPSPRPRARAEQHGHAAGALKAPSYRVPPARVQQRRLAESSRYQALGDSLVKLEKSLEAEVKRRAEADRQMQVRARRGAAGQHRGRGSQGRHARAAKPGERAPFVHPMQPSACVARLLLLATHHACPFPRQSHFEEELKAIQERSVAQYQVRGGGAGKEVHGCVCTCLARSSPDSVSVWPGVRVRASAGTNRCWTHAHPCHDRSSAAASGPAWRAWRARCRTCTPSSSEREARSWRPGSE